MRHASVIIAVVAVCLLGLLVIWTSSHTASRAVQEQQQEFAIGACKRTQLLKAYLIIDAGQNTADPASRQRDALRLQPFLDCDELTQSGESKALSSAARDRVIDRVASMIDVPDWNKQP